MAATPVKPGTTHQQLDSPNPYPLAPAAAAVEQAAALGMETPLTFAPSLVVDPPTEFNFDDKLANAYSALKNKELETARQIFTEIIEKSKSDSCSPRYAPGEFASGSYFYINCLVGYAESWGKSDENLTHVTNALNAIEQVTIPHPNIHISMILKRLNFDLLIGYHKRVSILINPSSVGVFRKSEELSKKLLSMQSQATIELNTSPSSARDRWVTPEASNDGVSLSEIFTACIYIFVTVVLTLAYRRVTQINPPSK